MANKLVLKSLSSVDVELATWHPASNDDIFICLDLEVGFSDKDDSTNLFYITVATPEALRKRRNGPILAKNRTILISEYDYDSIRETILDILNKCSKDSWDESCIALQRYFQWEYEDYSG